MKVEIRGKNQMSVSGYVNVVGRDSRTLRDASGSFIEQIAPGTFAQALQSGEPVELRFNHNRTLDDTNGTLSLYEDGVGLHADAVVTDPAVIEAAERGELRGWSFGFVCKGDKWETREDGSRHRIVNALDLHEVSILDKTPAYIATSIEARGEEDMLCEFRAYDTIEIVKHEEQQEEEREHSESNRSYYEKKLALLKHMRKE